MEASIPRNDRAFWADSIGGSSFDLDGERYTDQASVARGIVSAGDKVLVCPTVDGRGRRQMLILDSKGSSGRRRLTYTPFYTTFTLGIWLQSNATVGQNAIGGRVLADLLRIEPLTITSWPLPTSDEIGTYHAGLQAYGLARYQMATGLSLDRFGAAWPYLEEASGTWLGIAIGAWDVTTKALLWKAVFDSEDGSFSNPNPPKHTRFFHDILSTWSHALPDGSEDVPGRIFSAKSETDKITTTISKLLHCASLHSFLVPVEGEDPTTSSFFCLPYTPAIHGSGEASIDFYEMDQGTGEFTGTASFDVSGMPAGGSAAIPDLIECCSSFGAPWAWLFGNEAVGFCSGGILDLFDSDRWETIHWTIRSLKTDGTEGDLVLESKTWAASSSPTVLAAASLKAEALAAPYPLTWYGEGGTVTSGYWIGGIELASSDTDSEYAYFRKVCPILLPTNLPNTKRITGFFDALAVDQSGVVSWPEIKNHGGGIVVDRDQDQDTVCACVLVPEQCLYGGTYSSYVTEEMQETYVWNFIDSNSCASIPYLDNIEGIVSTPDGHPVPGAPGAVTPSTPQFLSEECPEDPGFFRNRTWSISQTDDKPIHKFVWTQKVGWLWRVMLYLVLDDGTLIETDVSQKVSVTHSMPGGGSEAGEGTGSETMTAIETDFPLGANVWQIISVQQRGIVILLRDLWADGLDKNPTPHLQVWTLDGGALTLTSTVRLGSYDELKTSDDETEFLWKDGDQEWNPYAFGPPRMKACRDSTGDNGGAPAILVMVAEEKKVHISTDSQFKRVCYALVDLTDTGSPTVTRVALTSPDEGVGSSGDIGGNFPLWADWDTLILTPGHVAWIRDSEFRETPVSPP